MSVVVEVDGALASVVVDALGDVVELVADDFEAPPATLPEDLRTVIPLVSRQPDVLIQVLDERALLDPHRAAPTPAPPTLSGLPGA